MSSSLGEIKMYDELKMKKEKMIETKERLQNAMEEDMLSRIKANPNRNPIDIRLEFLRNQCAALMTNISTECGRNLP